MSEHNHRLLTTVALLMLCAAVYLVVRRQDAVERDLADLWRRLPPPEPRPMPAWVVDDILRAETDEAAERAARNG